MQTFITDFDMIQNAKNLDNKRLGKQRVEALQIADCLLVKESKWKNHPAVKMWRDNVDYLIFYYIPAILDEWELRGFKNDKCDKKWTDIIMSKFIISRYCKKISFSSFLVPAWLNLDFIEAHRSNLIRKKPEHYKALFPNTQEGLPYIWPVK